MGSFGETAQLDVWIDNDGRPVRLAVRSDDTEANMTLELSDFGVDVDVDEPAPDETIGLEEFLNQTIGTRSRTSIPTTSSSTSTVSRCRP